MAREIVIREVGCCLKQDDDDAKLYHEMQYDSETTLVTCGHCNKEFGYYEDGEIRMSAEEFKVWHELYGLLFVLGYKVDDLDTYDPDESSSAFPVINFITLEAKATYDTDKLSDQYHLDIQSIH